LILRDEDEGSVTIGKVAARVALWVATLGVSEVFIEAEKERELENVLKPETEELRQGELRLPGAVLLIGTHRRAMEVVHGHFADLGVRIEEAPLLDGRLVQESQREPSLELQAEARRIGLSKGMEEIVFVVTRGHEVSVEAISVGTGDFLWLGRAASPGQEDKSKLSDAVAERLATWAFGRVWCAERAWNDQTGCQHIGGAR
jgi:hypothetical protein